MEDQYLISQLQSLKKIKPNSVWVFSVKNEILGNTPLAKNVATRDNVLNYSKVFSQMLSWFTTQRLAYALTVFLVVFLGAVGLMYVPQNSPAPTESPIAIKNEVQALKTTSQDLADAVKSKPEKVASAAKATKTAAKNLTDSIKKDPTLAKAVALEVTNDKALLGLTSSDDPEVKE